MRHQRQVTILRRLSIGRRLLPALLLAGCGKSSRDDCARAFDHFVEISLARPGDDPGAAERVRAGMARERDVFVDRCVKESSGHEVRCILRAKTRAELEACR